MVNFTPVILHGKKFIPVKVNRNNYGQLQCAVSNTPCKITSPGGFDAMKASEVVSFAVEYGVAMLIVNEYWNNSLGKRNEIIENVRFG